MNKKISEIMDDLECEWIKDIEDIDTTEETRIGEICFDKIKQRAVQGISESNEEENEIVKMKNIKKRKKKRFISKVLLPLVAALSVVGITVAAISSSDTLGEAFRGLFGEALPFIQSEIQDIKESTTEAGVVFTAEAAAIENKAGLFIVSFEKQNESAFEEGIGIKELNPKLEKRGGMGWSKQSMLTDEGRKLTYIVDLSADKNLYEQTMSFHAKDLGIWNEDETEITIDLAKAYEQTLKYKIKEDTWESYESENGIGIKVLEKKPEYRLDRVEFQGEELNLVTSYPYGDGLDEIEVRISLVDTRNNKEIEAVGSSGSWNAKENEMRNVSRFVGVTEEDLPYLQMKLEYRYFETVIEGEWQVDFKLTKNENVKEKKLLRKIENEEVSFTIHDLEVSKLGVKIEGWRHKGYLDKIGGYIQMKDGTQVELQPSGASSKWNLVFEKQYRIGEVSEDKEIEQQEKTVYKGESHLDGGTSSKGMWGTSEISVKTQSEDGVVTVPKFINVEEVESIVLEGVSIPLK